MLEITIFVLVVSIPLIAFCMWLFPVYGVWASRKSGEASFAEAQNEQRVLLSAASARLEAAEINKKAAIIEAEAVSAQIEKIGVNLSEHQLYLRWQWIEMMRQRSSYADTIYVATEAGLPILEATRRQPRLTQQVDEE